MPGSTPTLSGATFNDLGGAVSDIFGGVAASTSASLQAQGLDIEAQGTQIQAQSLQLQAQGDLAEGQEYTLAQQLAQQNAQYTQASTAIQAAQGQRQVTMTIGGQKAAVGGAGLAESGSALDLMRSSAQQGALAVGTLKTQGQINEAGYEEQAQSYALMASTAQTTAAGEENIAGEENQIATEQKQLASATAAAGNESSIGDYIGSALKGAAAVASLFPAA